MPNVVDELREGMSKLAPKDQAFAQSLLRARRPTDKQMHWIGILAERTKAPQERTKVDIGNMTGIARMFAHYAAHHVKLPKIVLHSGSDLIGLVVIHPAGQGSAFPGCLQVKEYEGDRRWFGRIYQDGKFELSPKFSADAVEPVTKVLRELSEKPIETAAKHGKLTGRCCFCNKRLGEGEDQRSVEVGYGPTCAESFGLDWGRSFKFEATPVYVVQEPAPKAKRSRRNIKVG